MTIEERATVNLTRSFGAPPDRVFQTWVDPKKAQRWIARPHLGEEVVRADIKARVGRTFSLVVRRDGDEIRHSGEYIEVVRPRRLVFTWVVPNVSKETTLVSIDLSPAWGGATDLALKHERILPAERSRTEARWAGILDVIATMVAA